MSFGGFIQANTQVIVTIGPFVDVGDGFTPETGITLGAADEAELLKHGSTSVVDISGATWAAVTNCDGYYSLTLTTSHTDTEGLMTIVVQDDSVCLPVKMTFQVIAQAAWASLITAKDTGFMDINVKAVSEDTTAADNLELITEISNITSLSVEADGMVHADMKEVEGGDATDALQAGAQAAIEANNLDHLAKTATAAPDMTTEVADNTILSRMLANGDTSAFDPSTDGLQPFRDHVGDGTNLTEAGGDGDHLTEAGGDGDHLTEAGGTGDQLTAIPWNAAWDAEVESEVDDALGGGTGTALTAIPWNAAWDAEVQSECADALTAYGAATSSDVTTVQNNATGEISVDNILEIPASGEAANVKPIEFFFKDTQGNMEAPDAAPTISAVNEDDTSRDGNLSSTTMSLVSTGRYKVTYSVADSHAAESLRFTVSVVEGSATRLYQRTVLVQDEIGNKIDALYTAFLSTSAELAGAPAHNASIIDKIEFMFMNMKNENVADNSGTPATISISNNAGSAIATANVTQTADTSTKAQYS